MNAELITATQGVCTAITELAKTFRVRRSVRKEELIKLSAQLKALEYMVRAQAIGAALRANIAEIAQTYRYISQQNMTGPALEMAMEHLRLLGDLLQNNIKMMFPAF